MLNLPRYCLMASVAAATLLAAGAGYSQDASAPDPYLTRSAQGVLSEKGGARRITGDATAALQSYINDGGVKNVILLIGDGMGDSEITIARNYAEGAGGFFKGIDALPITGQYTHYALDKKTGRPDYVTDSAASGTAWSSGVS
jgi:alkaline phosphatase